MFFQCSNEKCKHVAILPDENYGKTISCQKCFETQKVTGQFDPQAYKFVYQCSCGTYKEGLPFIHLGKEARCPKCKTVNPISYEITQIDTDPPTVEIEESELPTQNTPHITEAIKEKLKNAKKFQQDSSFIKIAKKAIHLCSMSFDEHHATDNFKSIKNAIIATLNICIMLGLVYLACDPPTFFIIGEILSWSLVEFLIILLLTLSIVLFLIFFILVAADFDISKKAQVVFFNISYIIALVVVLFVFKVNYINDFIESESIELLQSDIDAGIEVYPYSLEKTGENTYTGLAILKYPTGEKTYKYYVTVHQIETFKHMIELSAKPLLF